VNIVLIVTAFLSFLSFLSIFVLPFYARYYAALFDSGYIHNISNTVKVNVMSLIRCILLFIIVVGIPFVTLAQIPNGDFESWSGNDPSGWITYNFLYHNISPSTTAHNGSYSARAEIVNYNGNPVPVALQAGAGGYGFPVNTRYSSVTGYYQFNSVGGDKLYIGVLMYKGKGLTGTIVASSPTIIASSSVSGWTQFTAPINYLNANNVDTCIIQFQILGPGSGTDFHTGSYALIDDLVFGAPTGVESSTQEQPLEFKLHNNYPNPFNPTTHLSFVIGQSSLVTLKVYNVWGQEVASLLNNESMNKGIQGVEFDGFLLASGVYYYRLTAQPLEGTGDAKTFSKIKRMMLIK